MHVLVIPSWYPVDQQSVNGQFFRYQAMALRKAGFKVGVIAPHLRSMRTIHKYAFRGPWGKKLENDEGIPTFHYFGLSVLPHIPFGNSSFWLHYGFNLFSQYIGIYGMPDLIHAHSALYGGYLGALLKERFGIPYVLTEHSSAFARGLIRPWQSTFVKKAFSSADVRLAVSPQFVEILRDYTPGSDLPWESMPNFVDTDFFCPSTIDNFSSKGKFRFLTVSIMTEVKGLSYLLQAFSKVFRGNLDVELRLGGDGPLRKALEAQAQNLGISKQLTFLGYLKRNEVLREIQMCDALVHPSLFETFGVVLIEALACGKPVIATACGGPESIIHKGNGLLIPIRSSSALAKSMEFLKNNMNNYDSILIRKGCEEKFGSNAILIKLKEIYENITRM